MTKNLLLKGFVTLAIYMVSYAVNAQDYHSRFIFTTEISPSFPMDKLRIFDNPSQSNSLSIRARYGMRTFGNLFVGINGSVRRHKEAAIFSFSNPNSVQIEQAIDNTLFGLGPFLTQFIPLSDKFYFIATGYARLEQGKGKFISTRIGGTGEIGEKVAQRTIRDINLTSGLDLGFGYLINPSVGIKFSIQAGGYQRQSIRTGPQVIIETGPTDLRMDVDDSSMGIFTFAQRPVFNIGIFMSIGEWKY